MQTMHDYNGPRTAPQSPMTNQETATRPSLPQTNQAGQTNCPHEAQSNISEKIAPNNDFPDNGQLGEELAKGGILENPENLAKLTTTNDKQAFFLILTEEGIQPLNPNNPLHQKTLEKLITPIENDP